MAKEKEEQELVDTANREIIHVEDGSLIQNYEVDFPEEEELVMVLSSVGWLVNLLILMSFVR